MPYETLDLNIENHVAHVVMNRPEQLNTMIPAFWREIIDVFETTERTPEARVAVISSTGKRSSCGSGPGHLLLESQYCVDGVHTQPLDCPGQ